MSSRQVAPTSARPVRTESRGIAIRGVGVVGGFGAGLEALRAALAGGIPVPAVVEFASQGSVAKRRVHLADTTRLEEFVDKRAMRRLDHLSRLALLAASLALRDAASAGSETATGVAVATGYGATGTTFAFLDSVMKDGDPLASPTLFSSSVHNAPAAHLAIILGAAGPSLTVSQFELSVPSALLTARRWLLEGRADRVILGGVDEYCDVLGYCWERFFGPDPGGPCDPLEPNRMTAVSGEGAAFFLLTRDEGEAPAYGCIEQVVLGGPVNPPPLPPDALLLLGADGHPSCSGHYRALVPPGTRVRALAPLWGSFPAAPALDLAAASLILSSGKVPPQPGGPGTGEDLNGRPVCVLKAAPNGGWGLVTLRS